MKYLLGLCFVLFFAGVGFAQPVEEETIYLVPGHYSTIQAAIDACSGGETVLVSDGTYTENIDFNGKEIIVKSANGAAGCVIDGDQGGPVVQFINGEDNDSILRGFTITNGSGHIYDKVKIYNYGGGIYCWKSSPTIKNNIIHNNRVFDIDEHWTYAGSSGGGIYVGPEGDPTGGSSTQGNFYPLITGNSIYDNYSWTAGSAIYIEGGAWTPFTQIINNQIYENESEMGISKYAGAVTFEGGVIIFKQNSVYGNICHDDACDVYLSHYHTQLVDPVGGECLLEDNLIYEGGTENGSDDVSQIYIQLFETNRLINNTFVDSPGWGLHMKGYAHHPSGNPHVYLYNNIFYGNHGTSGFGVESQILIEYGIILDIDYCCIEDGEDPGIYHPGADLTYLTNNITTDPTFVDAANDDYHIQSGSGCEDTADPNYGTSLDFESDIRPYGDGYDIGCDERDS